MTIGFFDTDCKEKSTDDSLFGLCDDQDGSKAYSNLADKTKWIATIENNQKLDISFTAIDNCLVLFKEGAGDQESTCDGMLTFTDSLYLVELKKQGTGGWIGDAKKQLENTIRLLAKKDQIGLFKYKKAFACNKKHPSFTVIESAGQKAFFKRTNGFRLDVQARIIIDKQ